jgi:hypothetical protein
MTGMVNLSTVPSDTGPGTPQQSVGGLVRRSIPKPNEKTYA